MTTEGLRMFPFKSILVATDFGEPSTRALRVAVDLAKQCGASLTLIHAFDIPLYVGPHIEFTAEELSWLVPERISRQLDETLASVQKELPAARAFLKQKGAPWREILAAIDETKADLVVVGTHGRRGVGRAILGSVAEKVVRTSPVPVLTVGPHPEGST